MFAIFSKEFSSFMHSLIAVIVMSVFLIGVGLPVWVFPETAVPNQGYADLAVMFNLAPYVLMFLVPAITMRSFAEEKRMGTLEFLFTKPITEWQLVLGKYLATLALTVVAIVPTVVFYFSVSALASPAGNIDTPGVIGSYFGLVLLAGVFCAVGVLTSAVSPNQVVAFLISAMACFLLYYGFDSLAQLDMFGSGSLFIKQLGLLYHYDALGKGLIDSRDVLYLGSVAVGLLFITKTYITSRQW